jgi:hypothetical protein
MLNDIIRIGFLVLVVFILGLAAVWLIQYCYQEIRGTGQVVIDPLTVVDDEGKNNEEVGKALALMLHSRLESVASDLRDAQAGLTTISVATASVATDGARVGDVRLWTQNVALHTGILQPVDMKLSVSGVEVGGVLPWLQRSLSSRRTLHFTVYLHGNQAQVFGSLTPFRLSGAAVRLTLKGEDGKAPALDVVADVLAHEIIRRWLAKEPSNKLELLHPEEFKTLAYAVVSAAAFNRRSNLGRPAQNEFADLLPSVTALSDEVPDWPELGYFAAWIADKARDSVTAMKYYTRVKPKLDQNKQKELIALIDGRLKSLEQAEQAEQPTVLEVAALTELPTMDYSSAIKHVRDMGPEGSVVGQALATALEFQIAKATHEDHRISARHIYYMARDATGTTSTDSGAFIKDGVRALARKGAVEESTWPYVAGEFAATPPPAVTSARKFRISEAKIVNGLSGLKQALALNGPVVAGIKMFQSATSAEVAKSGAIPLPGAKASPIGGHAIVIVGYDDKQQRVKFVNSWGAGWGQGGFGYLPYKYIEHYMNDAWTFKYSRT